MKDCSDRYRDAPSSTVAGDLLVSGGVPCETQTNVDGEGVNTDNGEEGPSGGDNSPATWTQSNTVESVDDGSCTIGTLTEEELKEKHNKVCMILEFMTCLVMENNRRS